MIKKLKYLIVFAFVIMLVPTFVKADDTRIVISNVEITSNMEVPTYGGEAKAYYTYETTVGEPAYMTPHMGTWYKKVDGVWYKYNDSIFREGVYQWSNQIRIDGNPGRTHRLAEDTTLLVDGVEWTIKDSVGVYETYSMCYYNSPEYVVEKIEGYELTFTGSSNYNIGVNYVNNAINTYSVSNGVIGGVEPYVFSKTSGPDWINVASDGTISGTPTVAGQNENLVVRVTDAEDNYKEITITVGTTNIDPADRITIDHVELTSNMGIPTYGGEVKSYYTYEF